MAIFKNNIDKEIELMQMEETLQASNEYFNRTEKENAIRFSFMTGALIGGTTISIIQDKPESIIVAAASCAVINSIYYLHKLNHRKTRYFSTDYSNLDNLNFKELKRNQHKKDKYLGNLKQEKPSTFYCEESQDIKEEFGYSSDNNLPVQFLEKNKVPKRILREYELYSLKYDVPQLTLDEKDIEQFVNLLEEFLKLKNISHRIYYYTSNYFKRLLIKDLINYEDTITIEDFINELYVLQTEDYTEEEISNFQEKLREVFLSSKEKLNNSHNKKYLI